MAQAGLYVFTLFAIGRVHELLAFPTGIVLLVGVGTAVLALMMSPAERNPLWRQREVRVVVALSALAVLLIPFGVWPGGSAIVVLNGYSRVLVFFGLIVVLATSKSVIRNLVWSLLVGVGLLGVFTIVRAFAVSGRAHASETYDANDVAMIMVLALCLAAFAFAALRGVGRMVAAGVAVICVLATIMTISRGGFLGLALVCLILLFRLGRAALIARLALLGMTLVLLAVAAPEQYWSRMATIWNPTGQEYEGMGVFSRVELWKQGLKLLAQNALTGVGIGMYHVAEGLSHGGRGKWSAAHNSFIQVGTELGILGLTLFVALLVLSIHNARSFLRATKNNADLEKVAWVAAAVETSLYVYIVLGFGLSHAYSPMLYFLAGLATALRLQVERHERTVTAMTAQPSPVQRMVTAMTARPSPVGRRVQG